MDDLTGQAMRECFSDGVPATGGGQGEGGNETGGAWEQERRRQGSVWRAGAPDANAMVEGHIVMFTRGKHGSCAERSRCVMNAAELALALDWGASKLVSLREGTRGVQGGNDAGKGSGIKVRRGVHVVQTEMRSHSWLELIDVLQHAAVVVAPHGTQTYNVIFARVGTVLIELCAQTKEFKTAAGVDTYMSNDRFARAVGMRTWVLPFDGVGWHPSMSRKAFVVPPRRVLAILLLESGVRAVLLASMQWTLNPLTRTGSGAGGFRASFGWKHLDLVLEEQCDVKEEGGVRVREECLWVAVEVDGGRQIASAPVEVGTACSEGGCEGKGELTVDTGALAAGTYLFSLVLCTWPISLGRHSSQQPASLSRLGLLAPSQRMVVA